MVLRTDWSVPLDYFSRIGEVVFLKATSSISPQDRVERILILDFGSQYTQVIARRIREASVYSEIVPHTISAREVRALRPKGIILSGGPASVYSPKAPKMDRAIFHPVSYTHLTLPTKRIV